MPICKEGESVYSDLMMDSCEVKYQDSPEGGHQLTENFQGLTKIEKTKTQTYLGFVISSTGDNMANINMMKKKSIGVIRKIFNKWNSLNLQRYYFECAMILLNAILRPSILYACDMYYNLKESEIRNIERIEENYLRKVLNTSKGCPIVQLYLEMGHTPARVEIQKTRLLFMQYILKQSDDSTLNRFFKLQLEMPTRGDWASTCLKDLNELDIQNTLDEISLMTKNKFTQILRKMSKIRAMDYLTNKQGYKGKDIKYLRIEMSEYLLPNNQELSIDEKRRLFALRNKMIDIPSTFPKSKNVEKCFCGENENMAHIYECKRLNSEEIRLPYQRIYCGTISEQLQIFRKMMENLENRENILKLENERSCDPYGSAAVCSIG